MQDSAHADANIIFGTVIDDLLGDEVRVTVIAAGFDANSGNRRAMIIGNAMWARRPPPARPPWPPRPHRHCHRRRPASRPATSSAPATAGQWGGPPFEPLGTVEGLQAHQRLAPFGDDDDDDVDVPPFTRH